ncbi:MAG: TIGR02996 domain-containing protein [Myxococcales bacterium]|nr:TIGR02996 domain-containing protein [Myxococcales bacterium]MDP3502864.1 TIGR02996 domain-containing protein [Myxococcales bacterium]
MALPDPSDRLSPSLGDSSWHDVLAALLVLWRDTRHPRVAEAIDEVSTRLDANTLCPGGPTLQKRLAAWNELESGRSVGSLRVLLRGLRGLRREPLADCLERLAAWPADPRLVAWHEAALDELSAELHLPHLVRLGDPRVLPALEALLTRCGAGTSRPVVELRERLRPAIATLARERVRAVSSADLAVIERLVGTARAQVATANQTRQQLFAEVFAHPADDARRAVLADFLQAEGDPRGEFIALQLAAELQPLRGEALRAERRLLATWGDEWLAPLSASILKGATFRRGFPSACALRVVRPEALDAPAWATIERIDASGLGAEAPGALFSMARMPALRWLNSIDPSIFEAPEPVAVETLVANYFWEPQLDALLKTTSFPRLRELLVDGTPVRLDPMKLDALAAAPVGATLRRLACAIPDDATARWLRNLRTHRGPLTEVALSAVSGEWTMTLRPASTGLRIQAGQWATPELEARHRELLA